MNKRFILRSAAIRSRAAEAVANLPACEDRPLEVVIRPYKRRRSLAQNNLLHFWCREIANAYEDAYGERVPPETFKEYLKQLFLGQETREIMGEQITMTRHTSDLTVVEFRDFLERIDHWVVENLQFFLPRGDDYEEAMR